MLHISVYVQSTGEGIYVLKTVNSQHKMNVYFLLLPDNAHIKGALQ